MTKKKQSKRSAKQGAKKTSGSGVAPTLHEIPAIEQPQASQDAQALSAPEPIVTEPEAPDLAAQPTSSTSIASAVTDDLASVPPTPSIPAEPSAGIDEAPAPAMPTPTPAIPAPTPAPAMPTPAPAPAMPTPTPAPALQTPTPAPALQTSTPDPAMPEPATMPAPVSPVQAPSPSITNDIPTPPAVAAASQESSQQPQKTTYDIDALENAQQTAPTPDLAAAPIPPVTTSPALNPQSLGHFHPLSRETTIEIPTPLKDQATLRNHRLQPLHPPPQQQPPPLLPLPTLQQLLKTHLLSHLQFTNRQQIRPHYRPRWRSL
ncbi:MAG: hypothetical protein HYX67_15350 [Candidatus Melainabacteria bacterium]|nr:hypothetical protein [Candidatus Melainabacteria bacterium]